MTDKQQQFVIDNPAMISRWASRLSQNETSTYGNRSYGTGGQPVKKEQTNEETNKVNMLQLDSLSDPIVLHVPGPHEQVAAVNSYKFKTPSLMMKIGHKKIRVMIDTGADLDGALNEELFKSLPATLQAALTMKENSNSRVTSASGEALEVVGYAVLPVNYGDQQIRFIKFTIIRNLQIPALIGHPTVTRDVNKWSIQRRKITMRGNNSTVQLLPNRYSEHRGIYALETHQFAPYEEAIIMCKAKLPRDELRLMKEEAKLNQSQIKNMKRLR